MSAPEVDPYIGNFISGGLGAAIVRFLIGSGVKKYEGLPDQVAKIQSDQALHLQDTQNIREDVTAIKEMLEDLVKMVHEHDKNIAVLSAKGCLKPKGKQC